MSAIIVQESGGNPNALRDNTTNRSYAPVSRASAEALATRLLALGDDVDVGYMQVNSSNFAAYRLDVHQALEPCTNLAAGSMILLAAYSEAIPRYGPGQIALIHALSAYNAGNFSSGLTYARTIARTAGALRRARPGR